MEARELSRRENPEPANLSPGTEIGGLRIKRLLARGTSILTYLAKDAYSDELFFLEELVPTGLVTRSINSIDLIPNQDCQQQLETQVSLFLRKARQLTKIEASGALKYGESHSSAFLQREYEPGTPLPYVLQQQAENLNEFDSRQILDSCGFLLEELHNANLVHGDVQPANILVRPGGDATLLGICTPGSIVVDELPKSLSYFDYCSIEAFEGKAPCTEAGDIYALGASVYTCLTGSPPPPANLRVQGLLSGAEDPMRPAESLRRQHFDTNLYETVAWMLSPLASTRPPDINKVLQRLDNDPNKDGGSPNASLFVEKAKQIAPFAVLFLAILAGGVYAWKTFFSTDQTETPRLAVVSEPSTELQPEKTATDEPPNESDRSELLLDNTSEGFQGPVLDVSEDIAESLPAPSEESVALSRNDDDQRAKAFRELEQLEAQITPLLSLAKTQMADDRLTLPEGDNALHTYRQVLELNPDNPVASDGIVKIIDTLVTESYDAFEDKDIELVETNLAEIEKIDYTNRDLDRLQRLVAAYKSQLEEQNRLAEEQAKLEAEEEAQRQDELQRQQQIEAILGKAATAFADFRLISPADDSALFYYREVLAQEPNNTNARQGISRITEFYLERANKAIVDERFDSAEGFLNTVDSIEQNKTARLLREQLIDRKTKAEQQARLLAQQRAQREAQQLAQQRAAEEQAAQTAAQAAQTVQGSETNQQASIESSAVQSSGGETNVQTESVSTLTQGQSQNNKTNAALAREQEIDLKAGLNAYYAGAYNEAFRLLNPLAAAGMARAQFRLGVMYMHGRGIPKSTAAARQWFQTSLPDIQAAAREGASWAQADLGTLYEDGLIVQQSFPQAFRWYQRAAQQGYAGAQTNLGVMYASGQGVPRNVQQAVQWFRRAANQGDQVALENLRALGVRR